MKKTILDNKVNNNETFVANWNKGKSSFNHHKNIPESFRMVRVVVVRLIYCLTCY